jgi:hypothetical protein
VLPLTSARPSIVAGVAVTALSASGMEQPVHRIKLLIQLGKSIALEQDTS